MAKIKKKGVSGQAKNFITRTQAVRKLQISLPDFRRLCIFKGIYPREPRNKKKANKGSTAPTTFYYAKDIQYLLHEPVLQKFRDHKVFAKKLQKALGRREFSDARRLEETQKPRITLDHIVKERYPTFVDALRDLDDALSMLHLFANLPTNHNLPQATVASCQRLCNEWQHYIIRSGSLQKSFLSIKGIYYQAEIQGQDILWLVPYKFAQKVPADVDFRIMHTFVEFYTTLLGFVLFRLYTNLGLVYPPKFDEEADAKGAGLRAFKLESKVGQLPESTNGSAIAKDNEKALASLPDKIKNLTAEEPATTEDQSEAIKEDDAAKIDTFQPVATTGTIDVLEQPTANGASATAIDPTSIFSQTTFYLSRETPREPLEFLLRSCGCKRVGWDPVLGDGAFTENEADTSITHQIVDRPPVVALPPGEAPKPTSRGRIPGRIYVQPQYIWDCVNAGKLLPPAEYAPGALLPPHLSPWVKVREGGYDPQAPVEIDEEEEEENEVMEDDNGMQEDLESGSEESDEDVDIEKDEEEEESDEEDEAQAQYQRELEAETAGVKPSQESDTKKQKEKKKKDKKQREEEEMKEMQKIMMPKKKRKLYEKMVYSNNKKDQEAEDLRRKRVKIEKEKRKGKAGGR